MGFKPFYYVNLRQLASCKLIDTLKTERRLTFTAYQFLKMKYFFASLFFCFCGFQAAAQANATIQDSVHNYADFMPIPLLRSCEAASDSTWTFDSLRVCGLSELNALIAREMRYPEAAIKEKTQGRVIVSFVVDTFGRVGDVQIVKDIGNGCGAESVRIFEELSKAGLQFLPAMQERKRVKLRMMWPIKFKIREYVPPVYQVNAAGLKIYTEPDSFAQFSAGEDSLMNYITNKLVYPASERASCKTGVMEFSLLVKPDRTAEIEHFVDFNSLGFEFQWEASKLFNGMAGMWQPAMYHDTAVLSMHSVRILYKSDAPACAAANERFDQSVLTFADALVAYDKPDYAAAVALFTKALELAPTNTEYLYYRGSAHAAAGDKAAACLDYKAIREQLGTVWFPQLYRLMCE
jgi:TonB family protein